MGNKEVSTFALSHFPVFADYGAVILNYNIFLLSICNFKKQG